MKYVIKYSFAFVCFWIPCINAHFSNLQELKKYADARPEIVVSDNDDWFDPRYVSFYRSNTDTFLGKIKRFFGFSAAPEFDVQEFKNLVMRLNNRYQKETYQDIVKLVFKSGQRAVLWGDLRGAYHSLVRDLQQLQHLELIDDQLKITDPSLYFIFLGNVVNRSSYSLETLTVVLTLVEKNPGRVIYVRGKEEFNNYWENFTMRRALQVYAHDFADPSDGTVPLKTIINKFFNTLPRAVQVLNADGKPDHIYCVHDDIKPDEMRGTYTQTVIYGEHYGDIDPRKEDKGLIFLGFLYGTSLWSIVSSPVQVYKKFFNFHYDTFVVFEMGANIKKSILTLYSNDTRNSTVDFNATSFDIIFGNQLETNNDFKTKPYLINEPFEFGSTMDLTGSIFSLGVDIKRGIDVALQVHNARGGAQGYLVRPNIFNDGYNPRIASKNITQLLQEYKIPYVLAPVGSATLLAYLDRIKNKEILVLFPVTGAVVLRDPQLKHLIHLRASYADEICALIDYMIREYKSKNFAFFYQDDAYGKGSLEIAHRELEKRGIHTWVDIPYLLGQTRFEGEVEKLKKFNVDTIGYFSASLPTQHFLHELGAEYLKNKHLFGMSFLVSSDLDNFLRKSGIKWTGSSVVPDSFTSNLPIVQEYRKAMKANGFKISDNSLEGWIATHLLLDALKHITPPFTQENIIAYFEGLKNYNLGGIALTFNPHTRSFDLPVVIDNEDDELIEYHRCTSVDNPAEARFVKKDVKPAA